MRCHTCCHGVNEDINRRDMDALQLLANSSRSFRWPRGLDTDDFDQVDDPAEVILLELLAGQAIDLNRHCRVRLLL